MTSRRAIFYKLFCLFRNKFFLKVHHDSIFFKIFLKIVSDLRIVKDRECTDILADFFVTNHLTSMVNEEITYNTNFQFTKERT